MTPISTIKSSNVTSKNKNSTIMSSWLTEHLENFVKPVLGYVPPKASQPAFLSPVQMTRIKNTWRALKRQADGRTILLPGRDVWIFEVLARREGYPTKFIPQCSRLAVHNIVIDEQYLILDTGFMGSIPRALNQHEFFMISSHLKEHQNFPSMAGSRSLALQIEYLPKYWKTGYAREGLVGQELSDPPEFMKAAVLTQQVYTDSSPSFTKERLAGGILDKIFD